MHSYIHFTWSAIYRFFNPVSLEIIWAHSSVYVFHKYRASFELVLETRQDQAFLCVKKLFKKYPAVSVRLWVQGEEESLLSSNKLWWTHLFMLRKRSKKILELPLTKWGRKRKFLKMHLSNDLVMFITQLQKAQVLYSIQSLSWGMLVYGQQLLAAKKKTLTAKIVICYSTGKSLLCGIYDKTSFWYFIRYTRLVKNEPRDVELLLRHIRHMSLEGLKKVGASLDSSLWLLCANKNVGAFLCDQEKKQYITAATLKKRTMISNKDACMEDESLSKVTVENKSYGISFLKTLPSSAVYFAEMLHQLKWQIEQKTKSRKSFLSVCLRALSYSAPRKVFKIGLLTQYRRFFILLTTASWSYFGYSVIYRSHFCDEKQASVSSLDCGVPSIVLGRLGGLIKKANLKLKQVDWQPFFKKGHQLVVHVFSEKQEDVDFFVQDVASTFKQVSVSVMTRSQKHLSHNYLIQIEGVFENTRSV